jgi:hypothetical protein
LNLSDLLYAYVVVVVVVVVVDIAIDLSLRLSISPSPPHKEIVIFTTRTIARKNCFIFDYKMFIISILIVACIALQSEGFKLQRSSNIRFTKHQSLSMTNTEEQPKPSQIKAEPTQIKVTEIYSEPKVAKVIDIHVYI